MKETADYLNRIYLAKKTSLSKKESQLLRRAYVFGKEAHAGQLRASGEEYFTAHCVPVSEKIASFDFPVDMIIAGLLHDTIEDTPVTAQELAKNFGEDVAFMVDGVSKLGTIKYKGNQRHVESLRKFFVAVAKDTRVIIIKLCDRWHNLETLAFLPVEKRQRIAKESIEIHAQLASRLNIGQLVAEINDLAFPYAYPEKYLKTKAIRDAQTKREDETVKKMYRDILSETTPALGFQPKIDTRVKSLYSLYKKLEKKDWNIEEIFDLIAIRLIVKSTSDCYKALGVLHAHWRPVPGRVKDYISMPKSNGYRSLHTTVFSGSGNMIEIQIRTEEMHLHNEYGVASHHDYKNDNKDSLISRQTFSWLSQLEEFQSETTSEKEYLGRLHTDFFQNRIFCMTPMGDVIDLPDGATVLDFAFAVHTEIGCRASGAKVDGKYVALKTPLKNQQIVEIVVDKKATPSKKWLDWVTTSHAKEKIKREVGKKGRQEKTRLLGYFN